MRKTRAKPIISYDESEIIEFNIQERLDNWEDYYSDRDTKPDYDEVQKDVFDDSDIFRFEWEYVESIITEAMKGNKFWKAKVENFGWRSLDGVKIFKAEAGGDLLHEILPNTECTFYVYKFRNGLKIQNYHHDSPMGNEWYYILPIAESTYYKY